MDQEEGLYITVAQRQARSLKRFENLKKTGFSPMRLAPRRRWSLGAWGQAWISFFENLPWEEGVLERGKGYVRNGEIISFQSSPGEISALVSGEEIYETSFSFSLEEDSFVFSSEDRATYLEKGYPSVPNFEETFWQGFHQSQKHCSCFYGELCEHQAALLHGFSIVLDENWNCLLELRKSKIVWETSSSEEETKDWSEVFHIDLQ